MAAKKPHTILIVEDESSLNEAYQMILQQAGYDILSAFDGKEALDITSQVDPDLILLDLRMPVMDGLEFLQQYKPKDNRAKIVVFSNYDMQKEIEQAYELGADKYVLKALSSPNELLKMVKDMLSERSK